MQDNAASFDTEMKSNFLNSNTNKNTVEQIVDWIEATGTDVTSVYGDWLKIGFALADEFGQAGISYFHRVSRFYPKYTYNECKKKFNECLKGKGTGVNIATFFYYARQAGFKLEGKNESSLHIEESMKKPVVLKKELIEFPSTVFEELPDFLKECVKHANNSKERDILLLGSLTVLSSCLPNVYGLYDLLTVYPNLYLFITAPASSGKGRVNLCRRLVAPIHKKKRDETSNGKIQYEVELAEYSSKKGKDKSLTKPIKPKEQMLFIPANSSATGAFELLNQNDGAGLIFETEGDTLTQSFKSEHGNYSDGFRKAFHHESISYYRRTDSEYVDISYPKISTVLTGTPDQVLALMPDSQNGLFSRFMFYKMERQKEWRDVFANSKSIGLDEAFDALGVTFESYYLTLLSQSSRIEFSLSQEQRRKFHIFFSKQYEKFLFLQKEGLQASLFRLGLIFFRLTMILTVVRVLEKEVLKPKLRCEPRDFETALAMIKVLLQHTEEVFLYLPKKEMTLPRRKDNKELFLEELPKEFVSKEYRNIASKFGMSRQSAERYIKQFVEKGWIHKKSHGHYGNILKRDT